MNSAVHPPKLAQISLKDLSYFKTGGSSLGVFQPHTTDELVQGLAWILRSGRSYMVLGAGSNSLLSDEPYGGYVITLERLNSMSAFAGGEIRVGGGVGNSQVARLALERGYKGLEWMNGLPGQVGGSVRMNARCYGSEMADVVSKVTVVDTQGMIHQYHSPPDRLFFGYKDTVFMSSGAIITEVTFSVQPFDHSEERDQVWRDMQRYQSDRKDKGQYLYPSCGCVFKNDYSPEVGVSSGWLLEKAGVKGLQVGGARVSEHHANFIYNFSAATSEDILRLSFEMRRRVYDYFGVWLEYEMEILGHLRSDLARELQQHRKRDRSEDKRGALEIERRAFQQRPR